MTANLKAITGVTFCHKNSTVLCDVTPGTVFSGVTPCTVFSGVKHPVFCCTNTDVSEKRSASAFRADIEISVCSKRLPVSTRLHGVTPQQTVMFVVRVVETLNLSLNVDYITPLPAMLPTLCTDTLSHGQSLHPFNPLLALLGAHNFLHASRIRVKSLTLRLLMSYIYMEHPFLMFLDHTQRRSTVGRTPLDE